MSIDITVEGGKSKRLLTAGKYCDRDIVVTATGGGTDLPELTNPATAGDLMAGKQMINGDGEAVDGTFTLETEMTEQDSLIEQIKEALKGKAAGGGSGGSGEMLECNEVSEPNYVTIKSLMGLRIKFPWISTVKHSTFAEWDGLIEISLPMATTIGDWAFSDCRALVRVDLPVAESIGVLALAACVSLTSIDLPVATSIDAEAFRYCPALTSVDLPAAESIGNYAFADCTALTSVDLPAATSIGEGAFYNCTNLSTLILRNPETVCQIIVTAVLGTKIVTAEGAPTGEGFIYVPSALYEGYVELLAYQAEQLVGDAATAEYIARAVLRKIEDYPEICG